MLSINIQPSTEQKIEVRNKETVANLHLADFLTIPLRNKGIRTMRNPEPEGPRRNPTGVLPMFKERCRGYPDFQKS